MHSSRFGTAAGTPPTDAPLERWRDAGAKEGLTARDRLRDGVETALLALGNGILTNSANTELRQRVVDGKIVMDSKYIDYVLVRGLPVIRDETSPKVIMAAYPSEERGKLLADHAIVTARVELPWVGTTDRRSALFRHGVRAAPTRMLLER